MDELTFRVTYAAIGLGVNALLLFLFARKLDRKAYLMPVIIGFIFGAITSVVVGGGIISFFFGGLLTGYLLRDVAKWSSLFRAGGLNATLLLFALFVPGSTFMVRGGTYGLFTSSLSDILAALNAGGQSTTAEQLLYYLLVNLVFSMLIIIAIVALGAVIGGYLRKVLKPTL